jgi:predicted GNAT family acetyltransferase
VHSEVTHEPQRGRFIVRTGERESRLIYRRIDPGVVDFRSTFVHPSVRGQGVGEALVCRALEWARAQGLRVIPSCWFVDAVVRRHPEFEPLLER